MLDAHPEICNFGEFEYAVKHANDNFVPDPVKYAQLLQTDRAFLAHGFEIPSTSSYEEVIRSFLSQAGERSGKPIVGATVHSRFDLLRSIWPKARFIHLIRDPRDVARSCIGMGWVGNVWYGADYWLDAEKRWEKVTAECSCEDYHELSFEALVVSPEQELHKICRFLDLDYDARMLTYAANSTYEPPDASLVNQWKTKLAPKQVSLVESKCGDLMERRGYSRHPKSHRPSIGTRVYLGAQNSLARKAFNLRRYGWPLYLKWQIAKRLSSGNATWASRVIAEKNKVDISYLR
ncbi:sulfotransferase [Aeoliella sp. ICT_H6.2]|uniref:Sulfotransferase n=2 Tax=Aeoliella straminimaris TaxID=2954799 RepID=A0A9X2FB93_9BACT|nr:sulfotransferase [Aeoliella straminimaris]